MCARCFDFLTSVCHTASHCRDSQERLKKSGSFSTDTSMTTISPALFQHSSSPGARKQPSSVLPPWKRQQAGLHIRRRGSERRPSEHLTGQLCSGPTWNGTCGNTAAAGGRLPPCVGPCVQGKGGPRVVRSPCGLSAQDSCTAGSVSAATACEHGRLKGAFIELQNTTVKRNY